MCYGDDMENTNPEPTVRDLLDAITALRTEMRAEFRNIWTALKEIQADIQEIKRDIETIHARLTQLEEEVHINYHYYQSTRKVLISAGKTLASI